MNLKAAQILIFVLLAAFAIALWKDELRAEVTQCVFCCSPDCGGANGNSTPTPTATPTPTPTPTPSPDAVVAPSGGTHTTIAAAYAATSCGDLIWVRNGTYNITDVINLSKTCTLGNEITIQNYPSESPKIVCTDPAAGGGADRVEMNGQYNVWDGIEVTGCWDGVKIYNSNNKVLNSKIHNNMYTGIVVVPLNGVVGGIELAGNTIEVNGYVESGSCTVGVATSCTGYSGLSQKNVQQIYLSNTTCNNIDGVHIHGNTIRNYGGRAVQMNGTQGGDGPTCQSDGIRNVTIEDNVISGGSWGISAFYGISGIQILNNQMTLNSWPTTNDSDHTFFGFWQLANSEVKGNTLVSSSSSMRPVFFFDSVSGCPENDIDLNEWTLNTNDWIWNGGGRNDFSTNFTSVSGCGANDILN